MPKFEPIPFARLPACLPVRGRVHPPAWSVRPSAYPPLGLGSNLEVIGANALRAKNAQSWVGGALVKSMHRLHFGFRCFQEKKKKKDKSGPQRPVDD